MPGAGAVGRLGSLGDAAQGRAGAERHGRFGQCPNKSARCIVAGGVGMRGCHWRAARALGSWAVWATAGKSTLLLTTIYLCYNITLTTKHITVHLPKPPKPALSPRRTGAFRAPSGSPIRTTQNAPLYNLHMDRLLAVDHGDRKNLVRLPQKVLQAGSGTAISVLVVTD